MWHHPYVKSDMGSDIIESWIGVNISQSWGLIMKCNTVYRKNMQTVCALLHFVVVKYWTNSSTSIRAASVHLRNTIAPVSGRKYWRIWINIAHGSPTTCDVNTPNHAYDVWNILYEQCLLTNELGIHESYNGCKYKDTFHFTTLRRDYVLTIKWDARTVQLGLYVTLDEFRWSVIFS